MQTAAPVTQRTSSTADQAEEAPACKGTYSFVSLGCPKNLVDSERMLGLLQLDGYRLVPEPAGADFVVVNTCGFIERAREESYSTIHEMLDLKRKGDIRGVIVKKTAPPYDKERISLDFVRVLLDPRRDLSGLARQGEEGVAHLPGGQRPVLAELEAAASVEPRGGA